MKLYLICVLFILLSEDVGGKVQMTEKQLQAFTKMLRNVCQPKHKVTNELIDAVHRGDFVQDPSLMCYMECCLRRGKLIKNNQLDYESAMSRALEVPKERQPGTIAATNECRYSATSDDKCMAAFEIYKCYYFSNPENFYLP